MDLKLEIYFEIKRILKAYYKLKLKTTRTENILIKRTELINSGSRKIEEIMEIYIC